MNIVRSCDISTTHFHARTFVIMTVTLKTLITKTFGLKIHGLIPLILLTFIDICRNEICTGDRE